MNNSSEMFSFNSRLWYNNRRVSKSNEASLYLQVTINGKHDEFPLKLRWPVNLIDQAGGIVLPRSKGDLDASDYNLIIKSELAKHTEIFRTYRLCNKQIDIYSFARELKIFDQRESFITFIERERNTRYRKRDIAKKTWQNAHAVKLAIIQYDKLALFRNIDKKWMQGFKTHLINYVIKSPAKPDRKYLPGTVEDRIKVVKAYLKRAACEPLIHVDPDAVNFSNPKGKVQTTFLNREEIRRLIILQEGDLTDKQLKILKGWLFMAFTSLRISDLYAASSTWELSDSFLTFIPFKNRNKGKVLRIPLLPMAKRFVINATGNYFDLPNSVEFNETLKVLADKAGIKKRLTAHVARHTFGYLFMTTVGNLYGLKEILGHSKIATTERYAHLDEDYQLTATKMIQGGFEDLMLRVIR